MATCKSALLDNFFDFVFVASAKADCNTVLQTAKHAL
jgi:hypothetical protein